MPALLTRMSIRPKALTVSWTVSAQDSGEVTSPPTQIERRPMASTSPFVWSSMRHAVRSMNATFAPWRASISEIGGRCRASRR